MPITSYQVVSEIPNGQKLSMVYEFTWSTGKTRRSRRRVPSGSDHDAIMQSMLPGLETLAAEDEILEAMQKVSNNLSPEKVAEYQSQASFDRKVLGRCHLLKDLHNYRATLPFFQAVQSRGGPNANSIASYLGVSRDLYSEIADRYNELQGVLFFIDADSTWGELPEEFE